MTHLVVLCTASLALSLSPYLQSAQPWTSDTEVKKGIELVEQGDYDAAIVTLDRAARRLATDPEKAQILSYAYLYLGIAYLGKGHEAAAKAKFREAITRLKDLSLSPEDYPPKVIDLFEAAREETEQSATTTTIPTTQAAPAPQKKKGSKTPWILVGAGGAAAVGLGAAASGGSSSSTEPTPSEPKPPLGPQTKTDVFPGFLNHETNGAEVRVGPGGPGRWEAVVQWTNPEVVEFWLEVFSESQELITEGRPLSPTSFIAEWEAGGGIFLIAFGFNADVAGPNPGNYELRVTYPVP